MFKKFGRITFWKVYFVFFVFIGVASLFSPSAIKGPMDIVDYVVSIGVCFMLYGYAFKKRFGNPLLWKISAVAYGITQTYMLGFQPIDGVVRLSLDWYVTLGLILVVAGPSFYGAFGYAWGRLAKERAKGQKSQTAKARRPFLSILLQPFLGVIASFGLLAYGAILWVTLVGPEKSQQLVTADSVYVLVMSSQANAWLALGALGVFILSIVKHKFRGIGYSMLATLVLVTIGNGYLHYRINAQVAPEPAKIDAAFKLDPKLADLAIEAGLDIDNLKRAKAHIGTPAFLTDNVCGHADVIACFYNGIIYIYPVALNDDRAHQRSTVAHEYLHWAWSTSTPGQRGELAGYLNIFYGENRKWFDERLGTGGYKPGSENFTDELDSIIGTEVDPAMLPPELNDWYDRWIKHRDALPQDLKANTSRS